MGSSITVTHLNANGHYTFGSTPLSATVDYSRTYTAGRLYICTVFMRDTASTTVTGKTCTVTGGGITWTQTTGFHSPFLIAVL